MEDYVCCDSDIPEELYRVDYHGARTNFSPEEGFRAGDTTRIFGTGELNIFKRAVEKHFTWSCHDPLPFISLFSDREHAENWCRKQPWLGNDSFHGDWSLHIIDTTQLKMTTPFFKLSNLVDKLNLDIPRGAQQHIQGAFICLHRIPLSALVGQRSPEQVDNGKCAHAIL
jgi:hypothetical protein